MCHDEADDVVHPHAMNKLQWEDALWDNFISSKKAICVANMGCSKLQHQQPEN
jgi:hypothetical protein